MIDPRIYASILVPGLVIYFGTCFCGLATGEDNRAQAICNRVWVVVTSVLVVTALTAFLDWLWS